MNKPTEAVVRCTWAANELNIPYHDEEWGVPVHDEHKWFEFLILEGAQAGLSWDTILKKRARYQEVFDGFDPAKVALYDKKKVRELLRDAGIVRNRLKVDATISNAWAFLEVQKEFGTFDAYVVALCRRPAQTKRVEEPQTPPRKNARIRRPQQRPPEARVSICGIDHLLRTDAGHGNGERSPCLLLSFCST